MTGPSHFQKLVIIEILKPKWEAHKYFNGDVASKIYAFLTNKLRN